MFSGRLTALALVAASLALVPASVAADPGSAPRCGGRIATIVGSSGPDRIFGTPGDDVIMALGGRDRVHGADGDDVICGGPGPDHLFGGRGDDILRGQGSRDLLLGIAGDDRLYGGRDAVVRHADGRHIQGDTLFGGPGRDYLDPGEDLRQRPLGKDRDRPDSVSFWSRKGGIVARLGDPGEAGVVRGPDGPDVVMGQRVVSISATPSDDIVVGGSGSEELLGGAGDDRLAGGGGDDKIVDERGGRNQSHLSGGPGNDRIWSQDGRDAISGGRGDDRIAFWQRINARGPTTTCSEGRAGPGRDELEIIVWAETAEFDAGLGRLRSAYHPGCDHLVGFESYLMASRYDSISFVGTDTAEEFRAVTRLEGVTATMKGGDDVVVGTPWDDRIDAGPGNDQVDGRDGTDTCLGAEQATGCELTPPPSATCAGLTPTIVASGTNLPVLGTEGPDVVLGSDRNDVIEGLGGDDVICGLEGADLIDGGAGNDEMFGGDDGTDDTVLVGDWVRPGPGDDLVDLGYDARRETGDWDPGSSTLDAVDYSTSAVGITADLTPVGGSFAVTGEGTDTVTAQPLLELRGSPLADAVTGSPGADRMVGNGGDDILDGGGGDDFVGGEGDCYVAFCCYGAVCGPLPPDHDVLRGGDGNDTLGTTRGLDDLDGGAGDDELTTTAYHVAHSMLGGEGQDTVTISLRGATKVDLDGGPGADSLTVEAGGIRLDGGLVGVDAARGRLLAGAVGAAATMRDFTSYVLVSFYRNPKRDLHFRFIGSDSAEKVAVWNGKGRLRAWMGGGDDVVRGSREDDFVDGGEGFDRVRMQGGLDLCVDVEVARGCDL